jgi:small subunit ribosomal protein S8
MNYHVGDFILRVKNAYRARKKQVSMPYSNINKAIAHVLIKEGFLASVKESEIEGKRMLIADLRYENRRPAMQDIKLISKPSVRIYIDIDGLKQDKDRSLTSILSTSIGILTGKEAIKKGVGGELLFKIW